MLNVWTWSDADGNSHVGVSQGPQNDEILDLIAMDPAISSVAALWMMHPDLSHLIATLTRWLRNTSDRVAVPYESLVVPVPLTECWAAGVTYQESRNARREETQGAEQFYDKVYRAERPELFFKAPGPRVVGPGMEVGLRPDSQWHVPEPELTVVIDPRGQLWGYTAGNDVSCRDIEGENPLYLPQAKMFHRSAAMGPSIVLSGTLDPLNLEIRMTIERTGTSVFDGHVNTSLLRRTPEELLKFLRRAWPISGWTALMTGTALVPPSEFTLADGDRVAITIDGIGTLRNTARLIAPDWAAVPGT